MHIARSSVANALGIVSVALLCFLWVIALNFLRLNLRFPGGLQGGAVTMILAMLFSLLAGIWGRRMWFVVLAAAILTFVYIGFFYKLQLWY